MYLCKQDRPGDMSLLEEFKSMYNSRQVRIDIGRMLHEYHDNFKKVAQLTKFKMVPMSTDMSLVPILLNTLPVGGVAIVQEQVYMRYQC